MADLIDSVGQLLREAAATVVLPSFQHLAEGDVEEKAPGEVVTVADRRAETLIANGLRALLPDSLVVGEEGVAADPSLLELLHEPGSVWIVDPIDGTGNFAAGHGPFAIMAGLVRGGAPIAAWILDPLAGTLAVAEAGSGTYVDGTRATLPDGASGPLRGAALSRFLPADIKARVQRGLSAIDEVLPGLHCAGREYVDIVTGAQDFVLFWRTLPWDHMPGTLLVQEAGGVVHRLDGSPYDLTGDGHGLLAAANEATWRRVHATLLS
ncbi:inositol monophosphatase family protein [Phytohabitans sp. ZYX-F-186]|uniref:Inositol monophosphatase family protein n=1 Tax=Phytohabitans maris TaxID=3071409 RepID=A0ABU0Z8S9_9ACTN|nr:inositol monophosphatase family protein [Phytohabitans sp. ZYX-F-186]MDQ7903466.1 inositol monophosphatase family protein [Phytohabitans sp. ZYX-F-186]